MFDGNYDDDSDLTELDSEDEDEEDQLAPSPPPPPEPSTSIKRASNRPATKASTAKRQNAGKITPRLKKPRYQANPIVHIWHLICTGKIDLNAEYQRDVVWNEHKQVQLIDSIMHNLYIPPLVFSVISDDEGTETYRCIDGKQRLTAVQKFLDGQIPHKDHLTRRKLWYKNKGNQNRALLSQDERDRFNGTQLNSVEYDFLNDADEREIFQRVQLGVALSPAERMQAINSPNAEFVRSMRLKLAEYNYKLDRAKEDCTPTSRGRDFQTIAQILYLINRDLKVKKEKPMEPNSTRVEALLSEAVLVSGPVQAALEAVIATFCSMSDDPVLGKPLTKGEGQSRLSPVEFVMIGYLLYLYRPTLSLTQLSDAAEKMRKDVRKAHRDVRFNSVVYKHLLAFVQKVKVMNLKGDGEGDVPAARIKLPGMMETPGPVPVPNASIKNKAPSASASTSAPAKRKKADCDDDNGEGPKIITKRVKATVPSSAPLAFASSSKLSAPAPAPGTSRSKPPILPSKAEPKPKPKPRPPSPLFTPMSSPVSAKRKHGAHSDDEGEEVVQPKRARLRARTSMRVESPGNDNDADDENGRGHEHEREEEEDGMVVRSGPPKMKTPASRASVKRNQVKEKEGQGKDKEKDSAGRTKVKRLSTGSASTAAAAAPSKRAGEVKNAVKSTNPSAPAPVPASASSRKTPTSSTLTNAQPLTSTSSSKATPTSNSKLSPAKVSGQPPVRSSVKLPASKQAPSTSAVASKSTVPPPSAPSSAPERANSEAQSQTQTQAQMTSTPAPPGSVSISISSARTPSVRRAQTQCNAPITPSAPRTNHLISMHTSSTPPSNVNTNSSATTSANLPLHAAHIIPLQAPRSRDTVRTPTVSPAPDESVKPERDSPALLQLVPSISASLVQQTSDLRLSSGSPQSLSPSISGVRPHSRLAPIHAAKEKVRAQQEQALREEQLQAHRERIRQEQAQQAHEQQAQQEQAQQAEQRANHRQTLPQQQQQAHRAQQVQQQQLATNARGPAPTQPTIDPRVRMQQQQQAQPPRGPRPRDHWESQFTTSGNDPEVMLHEHLNNLQKSLRPATMHHTQQAGLADAPLSSVNAAHVDVGDPPVHQIDDSRRPSTSQTEGRGEAPLRVDTSSADRQPTMSPLTPCISPSIASARPHSSQGQSSNHPPNNMAVSHPTANVYTNSDRQMQARSGGSYTQHAPPPLSASSTASFDAPGRRTSNSRYSRDWDDPEPSGSYYDLPRDRYRERELYPSPDKQYMEWLGDERHYRPLANRGGRGPMNS